MLIRHAAITAVLCAVAAFSPSNHAQAQTAPNWVCTQDLNGDGSIDAANEQASCITTSNGELCPISAVNCVIQTSSAMCPVIAPLDPTTGKCEMPPQCSSGSYDSTNHYCTTSSPPACSSPMATFDSSTNLCESNPSCPSGATYNSTLQMCVTTSPPVCATGMTFNSSDGRCESVPSCPNGGTYSNATQMCQIYNIQDPTCPANTTFNAVTNMCEATYSCSQGTFDPTSKKCVSTYSASCPSGTTFDSMNGQCESAASCASGVYDPIQKMCVTTTYLAPTCPIGSALNQNTNMCEATPVCPSGSTYDSASQSCLSSPVCSSGTYDPTSKMCIAQSTTAPVCPPGLTYPGAPSSICSGSYSCPANITDNGSKCAAIPTCSSGTYDSTQHMCDVSNTTYSNASCPAGTSLNISLDTCTASPTCSIGNYDQTLDACFSSVSPACSTINCKCTHLGTFCQYPPGCPSATLTLSFSSSDNLCEYQYSVFGVGVQCSPSGCAGNTSLVRCALQLQPRGYNYAISTCGVTPICSNSGTVNPLTHMCEITVPATCPSGTSLNGTLDLCTSTPTCLSGTYDTVSHKCVTVTVTTIAATCPAGTSLNTATNQCEANYICPTGSSYDSSTHKCESSPNCSSGVFTSSTGNCVLNTSTAPTCKSGGTFNPALDQCVAALSCPAGLSWDSTKNVCDGAAPACTSGTYDSTTHMCATTTTAAPSCTTGTYNSGDGKCEAPLACPNGSTYDMILGTCALKLSPTCPSGTFFDSTATICDASPSCPNTYIYNQAQGKCIYTLAYDPTCPSGTAIDVISNVCYSTPSCNAGYSYDSTNFVCTESQPVACSSPSESFDTTTKLCESSPVCSIGTYDSTQKSCVTILQATCPTGGYLNTTLNVCQANPGCSTGTFDTNSGMCASTGGATASAICSLGILNTSTNTCQTLPTCSVGTYNPVSGLCVDSSGTTSSPSCPSGSSLTISSGMCETAPTCQTNYTYDTTQHQCVSFVKSCPLNTATITYQCMDTGSGNLQCSPNTCVDLSSSNTSTTSTANTTGLVNDGTTDPNTGQCQGQVIIFNGKGMTCRPPGANTSYFNCCDTGSGGTLGFLKNCSSSEKITVEDVGNSLCHYIGEYCSTRWKMGFGSICVQRTKTYCCFTSELGRIIHEQGRTQLQAFQPDGKWGTSQSPNCIGFTPEQFQMLDFSRMDLSEYFSQIQQNIGSQVQQNIGNNVKNFYQNTLH